MQLTLFKGGTRLAAAVACVAFSAASALAAPIYDTSALGELTGTRTLVSGLTLGGGNATAASFSWAITSTIGGYNYSYTFNANSQQSSLSHLILDLSDNCTSTSGCVQNANETTEFGTFSGGPGNPLMAGTITGVKFDGVSNSLPTTITFFSTRTPVYGDFYAKNGSPPKNGFAIYNTGLANHASENLLHFIARPDTITVTELPEPASLMLLGLAALGAGVFRRKRQA